MNKTLDTLLAGMTSEIYQRLATATETGKWPDGVALTQEQREHSLQLVMLWQSQHNDNPGHMTIGKGGEMVIKTKQQLRQEWEISDDTVRLTLN